MRNKYRNTIILCAVLFLLTGCIFIGRKSRADLIYKDLTSYLSNFPSQSGQYTYTELYVDGGEYEYLMLQNGENILWAKRTPDGNTEYFPCGNLELQPADLSPDEQSRINDVAECMADILNHYSHDSGVSYSYKKANGPALPLWVSPGESYLLCRRQAHTETHEVIASIDKNSLCCLRWYIVLPDDDIQIFLHACSSSEHNTWFSSSNIWGDLPTKISTLWERCK